MKRKAHESAAAVKSRAENTVEGGKKKYEDAKVGQVSPEKILIAKFSKDAARRQFNETHSDLNQKAEEAKARGRGTINDARERSTSIAHDVEAKYDSAKRSTGQLYDEVRDATERKARDIRGDLEKTGEDAKDSWFSLKIWGKSKAKESEDKLKHRETEIKELRKQLKEPRR